MKIQMKIWMSFLILSNWLMICLKIKSINKNVKLKKYINENYQNNNVHGIYIGINNLEKIFQA